MRFSYFNPVLAQRVIKYWSNRGDIVLDPFCGRSTRAVMTLELDRIYQGYEIAPLTFKLTKQHLENRNKQLFSPKNDKFQLFLDDGCLLKQTPD
ncbi:hypothetical protein DRP43_06330, partial [candidate division TA06 bacterium]